MNTIVPNMRDIAVSISLFLLLLLPSGMVQAHDFWIEPERFILQEPDDIQITLREGVDLKGDSLPYITDWFDDFSQLDRTGRRPIDSILGNDPAASIRVNDGSTVVGYQSTRHFVELGPEKFAAYLLEEGLQSILTLRKDRGEENSSATEYFIRCAKAFLLSGPLNDELNYANPLDYILELIPESDPYKILPGEELSIRLLYLGNPIEGIQVRAFTKDQPQETIDHRTDGDGRVQFTLDQRGHWLVKAVHLIPLQSDPKARWESYWASMTFEIQ